MALQVGDSVEITRNVRRLWRSVKLKTPGVVTAVKGTRYTVAFSIAESPGSAVVIGGLRADDLEKIGTSSAPRDSHR